ncbi:uncharacterized protein RAG0_03425 [Rhynchosporium agropyri]|uniref:Uncharacterized protein n=1 Tax=Rhynchosporium agropyri TaxID=914238 RepID=A0A1E1K4K0_9HELO|nr:uncharacterized protein RAG0_03425 [Rhynchosporium agropyri]
MPIEIVRWADEPATEPNPTSRFVRVASKETNTSSSKQFSAPASRASPNPAKKSNYQWLKDNGWNDVYYFMLSYQLRNHNDEDIIEGRRILKVMRDEEHRVWEQEMEVK